MRKALKIDDQESTAYSSRPTTTNSKTNMKQLLKTTMQVSERRSSETLKSNFFRMAAKNSFEISRNYTLNESTKAQQILTNHSQSPKAVETDRKSDKKKLLLTGLSDSPAFRIAPNNSNAKPTYPNEHSGLKSTRDTTKQFQPNQKDKSFKLLVPELKKQDSLLTDSNLSPGVKKNNITGDSEDADSSNQPKRPSYLMPTIARIQAQAARRNLEGASRFLFARRKTKKLQILEWISRESLEDREPFTPNKLPRSLKGSGSPTFSPTFTNKSDLKMKGFLENHHAQQPQTPSNFSTKIPNSANWKTFDVESQSSETPNRDYFEPKSQNNHYFSSENIQNEKSDRDNFALKVKKGKNPPQQSQSESQSPLLRQSQQLQQSQSQSDQHTALQRIYQKGEQTPRFSSIFKKDNSEPSLIKDTTPPPIPRLMSRFSIKTVNREDNPNAFVDSISTVPEEEDPPFRSFRRFWEKESSLTEEQKKMMLFQPANIQFFKINSEAPILVSMNTSGKIVEKNEVLSPPIQKAKQQDRNTKAIFAKFGDKNQIIQPDYMKDSGSMCFTELWGEKQKNDFFARMRKTMKQFKVFNKEGLKSQWDSVYRPKKIKNMQNINKKIIVQYTQDAVNAKLKQEETKRQSVPVDLSRRQSLFLSTKSSRNRIADTFGDVNMSFLVGRFENSPFLSSAANSPDTRRQSRWASPSELNPTLDPEKNGKSCSEEPLMRKRSDFLERRRATKIEFNISQVLMNNLGNETLANKAIHDDNNDDKEMRDHTGSPSNNTRSVSPENVNYGNNGNNSNTDGNDDGKKDNQREHRMNKEKSNRDEDDLKAKYRTAYLFNKKLLQIFGPDGTNNE